LSNSQGKSTIGVRQQKWEKSSSFTTARVQKQGDRFPHRNDF